MCTMTWFVTADGYELFFNRDERLSRSRAELPSYHEEQGVSYLSPTDSDAGGTWIAANQFGVTVCLLNHYQYEQIETYKSWVSRGAIVRQFACVASLTQAERLFKNLELTDYRAFRMFIIDLSGNNRLLVWDGHSPRVEWNVRTPKSSSSVDSQQVKNVRKALFVEMGLPASKDPAQYLAYHASHSPNKSQESVCMHRADAKTVSFSHVAVNSQKVAFRYADGSPCEVTLRPPVDLLVTQATPSNPAVEAISF